MKKVYLLLSILIFALSFFILDFKGYLSVRAYNVDKRADVQKHLNNSYLNQSFLLINKDNLFTKLKNDFNDLEEIKLKRNFDLSVSVETVTKEAFGRVGDNIYLDTKGELFYSDLNIYSNLPVIYLKEYNKNYNYLDANQMGFIKQIKEYPNMSVYIISNNSIQLVSDKYRIEIPNNFNSLANMATFVNAELKKDTTYKNLVVLKDKIVLKN